MRRAAASRSCCGLRSVEQVGQRQAARAGSRQAPGFPGTRSADPGRGSVARRPELAGVGAGRSRGCEAVRADLRGFYGVGDKLYQAITKSAQKAVISRSERVLRGND